MAHRVDGLPGDDHGHHRRFACAGGQLEREAQQVRIGVRVDCGEMVEKAFALFPDLGRDFREPDNGFDRFHLTKERADAAEIVRAPMLQQAPRHRRDPPVVGILDATPAVYLQP